MAKSDHLIAAPPRGRRGWYQPEGEDNPHGERWRRDHYIGVMVAEAWPGTGSSYEWRVRDQADPPRWVTGTSDSLAAAWRGAEASASKEWGPLDSFSPTHLRRLWLLFWRMCSSDFVRVTIRGDRLFVDFDPIFESRVRAALPAPPGGAGWEGGPSSPMVSISNDGALARFAREVEEALSAVDLRPHVFREGSVLE